MEYASELKYTLYVLQVCGCGAAASHRSWKHVDEVGIERHQALTIRVIIQAVLFTWKDYIMKASLLLRRSSDNVTLCHWYKPCKH